MRMCSILCVGGMEDDRALKTWVSDKLHGLVGYSQGAVVQFVIGLCKSAFFFFGIRELVEAFCEFFCAFVVVDSGDWMHLLCKKFRCMMLLDNAIM